MRALAMLLAGALTLAGCDANGPRDQTSDPAPSPILYEISDSSGQLQGWLFGTIHALPDDVEWRTDALDRAVEQASLLVVEIGDLQNTRGVSEVFSKLAVTPGQAGIRSKVPSEDLSTLDELLAKGHYSERDFANIETWAAALMLAQVSSVGSPRNGVDRALLMEFPSHRVHELEGALEQLSVFDRLAPEDQSDLLEGVIEEYRMLDENAGALRQAWINGDETALVQATQSGILSDPELYEALLAGRNRAWMDELRELLAGDREPLIAVGAAHLVGPDGLAALLEQQGYKLERLQ